LGGSFWFGKELSQVEFIIVFYMFAGGSVRFWSRDPGGSCVAFTYLVVYHQLQLAVVLCTSVVAT